MTPLTEVTSFLEMTATKGFVNPNTSAARQTAVRKFSDIVEEDQRTVEYMRDNLEIVRSRFLNLNPNVNGATVEEYSRRIRLSLDEFDSWKQDRVGWERAVSQKQSSRTSNGDADRKAKSEKPKNGAHQSTASSSDANTQSEMRTVSFPIGDGAEMVIKIPKAGVKVQDLKRAFIGLLPYANDWEVDQPSQDIPFMQLGNRDDRR